MAADELTERERTVLEHLKQAQTLGSTLKDYAEAFALNVSDLYNGKAQLQRKGLWPTKPKEADAVEFLPVTIVQSPSPQVERCLCRLRHPSGWVLECERFPEAAWVRELMAAKG